MSAAMAAMVIVRRHGHGRAAARRRENRSRGIVVVCPCVDIVFATKNFEGIANA